jgi:hypothetical protein
MSDQEQGRRTLTEDLATMDLALAIGVVDDSVRGAWRRICMGIIKLPQQVLDGHTMFWVSWYHKDEYGPFLLNSPWWITGEDAGSVSVCAAVRSFDCFTAMSAIRKCYDKEPSGIEFRFCEKREEGWSPFSDRFPKANWMKW